MRRLLACLVLLLSSSTAFGQPSLAGNWFGYGQPDSKNAMYLDRMQADGTFRVHHRTCIKGKAFDQHAAGRWVKTANGFTINIETVNGQPQPRTDVYRLISMDAQKQRYVYLPTNFPYEARRVPGSFQMPPCDLVS